MKIYWSESSWWICPLRGCWCCYWCSTLGFLSRGPQPTCSCWKTQASGAGNRCAFNNDFSFGFSNVVSTKPFWCQMQGGSTKQLRPTLIVVPEQNKREGQRKKGGDAKVGSYRWFNITKNSLKIKSKLTFENYIILLPLRLKLESSLTDF